MKLLAIDTAANLCAACIWDNEASASLASVTRDIGTGHAEQLMQVIDQALGAASLTFLDLDRIGVVVGPGSFTGVRVGVAAARGFGVALRIPVVGTTTLKGLAVEAQAATGRKGVTASVIDARRGEFYSALYDDAGDERVEPAVGSLGWTKARVAPATTITGSGAEAMGLDGIGLTGISATASIETYAALMAAVVAGAKPAPLYLRGADAKPQASFVLPGRD